MIWNLICKDVQDAGRLKIAEAIKGWIYTSDSMLMHCAIENRTWPFIEIQITMALEREINKDDSAPTSEN